MLCERDSLPPLGKPPAVNCALSSRRIFMFRKFAVLLFVMLLATPVLADEVSTKYISVDLPDNWKAVMAPTENQGTTTVIFSNASGNSTVGFVTGPNGGADTKTVAEMFANQFKAPKPPVEKNGQYTFAFTQQQTPCQSWVAASGDIFMVTTITGDRKLGLAFIKKYVKSAEYASLLPK